MPLNITVKELSLDVEDPCLHVELDGESPLPASPFTAHGIWFSNLFRSRSLSPHVLADALRLPTLLAGYIRWQLPAGDHRSEQSSE